MSGKKKKQQEWAEAKRRCRLNEEELQMAKELGIGPRSLIKNIPSPQQRWKEPVKEWVRSLHAKKFHGRRPGSPPPPPQQQQQKQQQAPAPMRAPVLDVFEAAPESGDIFGAESGPPDLEMTASAPSASANARAIADDSRQPLDRRAAAQDELLRERQREFRRVAETVAQAIAGLPWVERIALFGSLAVPLKREVPRFSEYRRRGIELWHEVNDIDLAVWVSDLT
ncbi:MAG: hypothetical protein M3463_00470, partial [Verrucomicrobiota bacterium]|nr:hypothetical protein [Verrucomicrobiota bacterium]